MMRRLIKFKYFFSYLIPVWLCFSCALQAQLGRRPAKDYIPVLENPDRLARLQPDKIVALLNLRKEDTVADIGAGSGVFTRRLAQALSSRGKVFAIDIDQELLDYNRGKIQEAKLNNVKFILGEFDNPQLPPKSVDLVFICDVVHHIEHRQLYLSSLRESLKPAGRVAIIDYKTNWPAGHEQMKYTTAELLTWMTTAGFQKKEEFDLIPDAFFFIFVPVDRDSSH